MTRKPLSSALQAEKAKPEAKPYKLAAGEGLFLEVLPTGKKRWRLRYFYMGKEQMLSLGMYPYTGFQDAKLLRHNAKQLLAQGKNPSAERKAEKAAKRIALGSTFETVALRWLEEIKDKKAEVTIKKSRWLLQFAFDAFGNMPISEVRSSMVLDVCKKIISEGKVDTAHRIKTRCSQVFRYAVANDLITFDPLRDTQGQLETHEVKHRAAITKPIRMGELLRDIESYNGTLTVRCALKLSALWFIRPGELRATRWDSIDFEEKTLLFIPPKTRKKTAVELLVPLSRQALEILHQLHAVNGRNEYVFRSHGKEGYLSENAVNGALTRMGYKNEMTAHGFRAMAKTTLKQRLKYRDELTEMQLGHEVKDMHGKAYNRVDFIDERTEMMQAWADYLDALRQDLLEG